MRQTGENRRVIRFDQSESRSGRRRGVGTIFAADF
jgi:hypothetical protein